MTENIKQVPIVDKIHSMFLSGMVEEDIATELDVDLEDVQEVVMGEDLSGTDPNCAYYLKENLPVHAVRSYMINKGVVMELLGGKAAKLLNMALDKMLNEFDDLKLSVQDLNTLKSIVLDMDKVARLDAGKATEIHQFEGMTPEEAMEILRNDPFAPKDVVAIESGNEKKSR